MANKVQLEVQVTGSDSVEKASGKVENLKTKLRELKKQLAAGNLSADEFTRLAQQAGELDDRIRDVNATVKALGSDTRRLDGFIDIAQGITGGFAAAQGAMALFGAENKDVEKALLKVQGAVALLNGVQAVANFLQKESSGMLLLQTARLKILNFVEAQRAASLQYTTVAMQRAAFAARMLGAALGTLGIGLLIAGLVMLIPKIIEWTSATKAQREEQERLNGEIQATNEWLDIELQQNDFFTQRAIKNAKLRGATEEEILAIENKGREKNIQSIKNALAENEKLTKEWNVNRYDTAENAEKALTELQNQTTALNKKLQEEQDKDELADLDTKLKIKEGKNKKSDKKIIEQKKDTFRELMDELEREQEVQQDFEDRARAQELERERLRFDLLATEREKEIKAQEDIMNERLGKTAGDNELMLLIQDDFNKKVAEINKKYADEEKRKEDEARDKKNKEEKAAFEERLSITAGGLQAIADVTTAFAGKQTEAQKRAFMVNKALNISTTLIDTYTAAQKAYNSQLAIPTPDAPIRATTAAGVATLSGLARVAAISKTQFGSTTYSNNSNGNGGAFGNSPNIPSFNTQQGNGNQTGGQGNTRVFVTETDISSAVRRVNGIYSQATIE